MKHKEAKGNTVLNQYLREKKLYCYYELKVVRGLYFNFSLIEVNQDEGLPALEENGLVWKLSDEDSRKKPCDGFCAPPLKAFLVLKWNNSFYFMRYSDITRMRKLGQKSISQEECFAMADLVFHI